MDNISGRAASEASQEFSDVSVPDSANSLYSYDTALVSGILRTKRKVRSVKACFPCRSRKVRCDGRVPCTMCVQRDHASLCRAPTQGSSGSGAGGPLPAGSSSSVLSARTASSLTASTDAVQSRDGGLQQMVARMGKLEEELSLLRKGLVHLLTRNEGSSTPADSPAVVGTSLRTDADDRAAELAMTPGKFCIDTVTGATIFLGSHSDPPSVLGCVQPLSDSVHTLNGLLPDYLMPKTYAFENIWAEVSVPIVCRTLPSDSDISW